METCKESLLSQDSLSLPTEGGKGYKVWDFGPTVTNPTGTLTLPPNWLNIMGPAFMFTSSYAQSCFLLLPCTDIDTDQPNILNIPTKYLHPEHITCRKYQFASWSSCVVTVNKLDNRILTLFVNAINLRKYHWSMITEWHVSLIEICKILIICVKEFINRET